MGLFDKIKQSLFKSRENTTAKMDALVENYREKEPEVSAPIPAPEAPAQEAPAPVSAPPEPEARDSEPKREGFFAGLFGGKSAQKAPAPKPYKELDDDFYEDLADILIMADVGVKTTEQVVSQLKTKCRAEKIGDPAQARLALREILIELMGSAPMTLQSPMVLLVIGVNGVGKTTSIGKLATRMKTVGRRVVLCAGDTFRAAAAEQLTIWAERADVPIVKQKEGADPAAVVFDGIQTAKAKHADILIVDTAGRLHNKAHLMEELKKIGRVVAREYPEAILKALLVIDATTGQNGLSQAQVFRDTATLDGIILTKLDGTAKGGIAIAIRNELGLPVRYIGIGEKLDDLEPFEAKDFIEAIF